MTSEEHLNRAEELLEKAERSAAVPGNAGHASALAQIAQAHVGLALAMDAPASGELYEVNPYGVRAEE